MAITINGTTNTIAGVAVGGLPDGIVDTDMLAANAVSSAKLASGAGGKFTSYAIIADQKANNAISGNFVSGDWRTRDLNTELTDADGIVSISSNQFTLQAGSYLIKWSCPAYGRSYHQSRLRNVTDGSSLGGSGTSVYADYSSNVQNTSIGSVRVTIGAAKAFEIQHRCSQSNAHNSGFGVDTGFDVDYEIFTIVEIYKEI